MGNAAAAEGVGAPSSGGAEHLGLLASTVPEAAPEGPTPTDGDAQATVVEAALATARLMASHALASVHAVANGGPDADLFEARFHSRDAETVSAAASVLALTQAGLSGEVPLQIETWTLPWNQRRGGYVVRGPFGGAGDIHLNPMFFEVDARRQAMIVLHEATHKYAAVGDSKYISPEKETDALSTTEALDNADSYAVFALAVFDRRAAEASERAGEEQREAALGAADLILTGVLGGTLRLWEDSYVTEDGTVVPPEVVADVGFEAFRAKHPDAYAEVVGAVGRGEADGDLAVGGGLVVPAELVAMIGQVEGVWE